MSDIVTTIIYDLPTSVLQLSFLKSRTTALWSMHYAISCLSMAELKLQNNNKLLIIHVYYQYSSSNEYIFFF